MEWRQIVTNTAHKTTNEHKGPDYWFRLNIIDAAVLLKFSQYLFLVNCDWYNDNCTKHINKENRDAWFTNIALTITNMLWTADVNDFPMTPPPNLQWLSQYTCAVSDIWTYTAGPNICTDKMIVNTALRTTNKYQGSDIDDLSFPSITVIFKFSQ